VRNHRELILSAIYTLVLNWKRKGCKDGGTFTSFERWGKIVGGILETNGLGEPTKLHDGMLALSVGGDPKQDAMKELFAAANKRYGDD